MSATISLFLDCAARTWRTPTGDPGAIGWALTLGYAVAALLCFTVARRTRGWTRERVLWALATVFLAFLSLNKQLDLQVWFTASSRCVAKEQDWYGQRRAVQREFVQWLAFWICAALLVVLLWMRRSLARNALLIVGLAVLAGFILLRAISFHHADALLRTEVFFLRAHRWVEMSGIALCVLASALRLRRG